MNFKKLLIACLVLLISIWRADCSYCAVPAGRQEIKAMWITRFQMDSPKKIETFVQKAKENGFNTLFVQVLGRGIAYYDSKIIPKAPLNFDPLRLTVEKSHNNGIKVHAWLNAYYVWSQKKAPEDKKHVVNRHPEWLLDEDASDPAKFLNPSDSAVQDYLYGIYVEVARNYAVDGIHMDYIRYPNEYSGFDYKSRRSFSNSYWLDPVFLVKHPNVVKKYYGEKGFNKLESKWASYRCRQVSELVKKIYLGVKSFNRNLEVSAAVYADSDIARMEKGQDWVFWLKDGIVDFVVPMIYSNNFSRFRELMKFSAERSKNKKVVIGLGAYLLSSEALSEQLGLYKKFSRKYSSLKGFCLFSYDSMSERPMYLEKFKKYAF